MISGVTGFYRVFCHVLLFWVGFLRILLLLPGFPGVYLVLPFSAMCYGRFLLDFLGCYRVLPSFSMCAGQHRMLPGFTEFSSHCHRVKFEVFSRLNRIFLRLTEFYRVFSSCLVFFCCCCCCRCCPKTISRIRRWWPPSTLELNGNGCAGRWATRCAAAKKNKTKEQRNPSRFFFCVPEGDVAGCPSGSDSAGFFSIRSSIVGVDPKEATHIEPRTSRSLFYLRGKFRKKNQTTKKSTKVAMESDHDETTPNGCSTKNQKKKRRDQETSTTEKKFHSSSHRNEENTSDALFFFLF